jgi:hypothetical protein
MKKFKASRSHHAAEIAELAVNRELAIEYLKAAIARRSRRPRRGPLGSAHRG